MTDARKFDPAELAALRGRERLSAVIGRELDLKKRGQDFWAACPFHAEKTPSFSINDRKGFFHCFGCGANGDVFGWFMKTKDLTFPEAVRLVAGDSFTLSPDERARLHKRQVQQHNRDKQWRRHFRDQARKLWHAAQPIEGTLGEQYFRLRGITCPLPPKLRFHPSVLHPRGAGRDPDRAAPFPAVIAAIQDQLGHIVAVHRIYLGPDGRAPAELPKGDRKLALASYAGACVMLSDAAPVFIATEGIENGLAFVSDAERAGRRVQVHAAVAASNIKNLLWPATAEPFIGTDADAAGAKWAQRAVDELAMCGVARLPRIIRLPQGQDANDVLQRGAA